MKKGDIIHGYRILEDFRVEGGMSTISFAERGGKKYFIKEFLSPKYPLPGSPGSERVKEQKRKACEKFEQHHKSINSLIKGKCSGLGGNLIYALDFFREGSFYYKVNERIDTSSLSLKEISSLSSEKILIIAASICQSLSILHDLKIVHGDLKPDNILIKETSKGNYTGKLIDFDDSYFTGNPPESKSIVGTPEYYSPELGAYITDKDTEYSGKELTLASDVFTLGIIFCEYFTGEKPITESSLPTWSAVAKGYSITFAKPLKPEIESLIRSMLSLKAVNRPFVRKVQDTLRKIKKEIPPKSPKDSGSKIPIRIGKGFAANSSLRGTGLKIADK